MPLMKGRGDSSPVWGAVFATFVARCHARQSEQGHGAQTVRGYTVGGFEVVRSHGVE